MLEFFEHFISYNRILRVKNVHVKEVLILIIRLLGGIAKCRSNSVNNCCLER